jgi:hypothetical protein
MRPYMLLPIALSLLVTLGCAAKSTETVPETRSQDEPVVRVRAPRTMFMRPTNQGGVRPVRIPLQVTVARVNEEYWCRFIEIEWGDETTSEYDQDCFPFDTVSADELRETRYYDFVHLYKMKGSYDIFVYLKTGRGGDTIVRIQHKLVLR